MEPPRLATETTAVSSRAFMMKRSAFYRFLPIKAWCLNPLRRFHRALHRRPPWLALEQMFELEKLQGRIKHSIMPTNLGFSLHVARRQYAVEPWVGRVVKAVEMDDLPKDQTGDWNLMANCWLT